MPLPHPFFAAVFNLDAGFPCLCGLVPAVPPQLGATAGPHSTPRISHGLRAPAALPGGIPQQLFDRWLHAIQVYYFTLRQRFLATEGFTLPDEVLLVYAEWWLWAAVHAADITPLFRAPVFGDNVIIWSPYHGAANHCGGCIEWGAFVTWRFGRINNTRRNPRRASWAMMYVIEIDDGFRRNNMTQVLVPAAWCIVF